MGIITVTRIIRVTTIARKNRQRSQRKNKKIINITNLLKIEHNETKISNKRNQLWWMFTRVKNTLEEHPNIEKAQIYLAPKGATLITMKKILSVDELQKQLNTLDGYTISELN